MGARGKGKWRDRESGGESMCMYERSRYGVVTYGARLSPPNRKREGKKEEQMVFDDARR
jgi:hypothetical protein